MKFWVTCLSCGFKEKIELIPIEEAIRQKIPTSSPRCKNCKSSNVKTEKA